MDQRNQKTALVTGASRGIGKGIALKLAEQGYDLAITYAEKESDAADVARQITGTIGRKCIVIQASLEREEVPDKVVAYAWEQMGRLDLVVNNAGRTIFDRFVTMSLDRINYLINLDFKAYLLIMQEAGKRMLDAGVKGSIINITSTRGIRAYPEDAVYGAVKAALHRATQSIALELAPNGIRVNCVAPGITQVRFTPESDQFYKEKLAPMVPLRRTGMPEDVANAVVWLASDQASYITGEIINVSGGLIIPGMPERPERIPGKGWA